MITGKTLIAWGYAPGPWFAAAIAAAEKARLAGADEAAIRAIVDGFAPPPAPPSVRLARARRAALPAQHPRRGRDDADNLASVERHMRELMRVPTLVAGIGDAGRLPVRLGARHDPGRRRRRGQERDPSRHALGRHLLLDGGHRLRRHRPDGDPRCRHEAHPLRRRRPAPQRSSCARPRRCWPSFAANPFLRPATARRSSTSRTQGDGNHFFYVGRLASTGQVALVTHHGSRKPGAMLYKAGMEMAESYRRASRPRPRRTMPGFPSRHDGGRSLLGGAAAHPRRGPRRTTSPSTI